MPWDSEIVDCVRYVELTLLFWLCGYHSIFFLSLDSVMHLKYYFSPFYIVQFQFNTVKFIYSFDLSILCNSLLMCNNLLICRVHCQAFLKELVVYSISLVGLHFSFVLPVYCLINTYIIYPAICSSLTCFLLVV